MNSEQRKPVYEMIRENLKGNELPSDFSLEEHTEGIHFAPGAEDGILFFHTAHSEPDEDARQAVRSALHTACLGDFETAEHLFKEASEKIRALFSIRIIEEYLNEASEEEIGQSYAFAMNVLRNSSDPDTVKFALAVLGMFGIDNPNDQKVIRTLALYDDFTFLAACSMKHWRNGEWYIYNTLKNVHGWGRIFGILLFEPTDKLMEHWLLMEGIHNDVMPEYSALECYEKAKVRQHLQKLVRDKEFNAITEILSALVQTEVPVANICDVDDWRGMLKEYLDRAKEERRSITVYQFIKRIQEFAEKNNETELAQLAETVLSSEACRETVTKESGENGDSDPA